MRPDKGALDVIVFADTVGSLDDCQAVLEHLHPLCTADTPTRRHADTRIIVAYYSKVW